MTPIEKALIRLAGGREQFQADRIVHGKALKGIFVSTRGCEGQFGHYQVHYFLTGKHYDEITPVFGSCMLNQALEKIPFGKLLKITRERDAIVGTTWDGMAKAMYVYKIIKLKRKCKC